MARAALRRASPPPSPAQDGPLPAFPPDTVARCAVLRAATRTPACPTVHRALRHGASPHHLVAGKTGTGLRAPPTAPCCGGADSAIPATTPQDRQALSAWWRAPVPYRCRAVTIQTSCLPCKTHAFSYGFSIPQHHTAIPNQFTQLLTTVFQGLQLFFISPYKIFWIFLPKNRNYCQFMSINAVFLQQLTQLQFVHSLQLSANRCTLHTKARDR